VEVNIEIERRPKSLDQRHGARRTGPSRQARLRENVCRDRSIDDAQGAFATFNLVKVLPKLVQAGVNVKVISAVSEELFDRQPEAYRRSVLPVGAKQDMMFITGGTRRVWPLRNVGAQADDHSLTADWDNQWLRGGLEADVIAEAHLDPDSVFAGVKRFADERASRLEAQRAALDSLE
jgi:hypothetical protein